LKNLDKSEVRIEELERSNNKKEVNGLKFTGSGKEFIKTVSEKTGLDGFVILDSIINHLLVKKGVDWNNPILGEYLGIFNDSLASFSLIWDKNSGQFVSHGVVFQSKKTPGVGLVAHIRTLDDYKGMGLGTLVTEEVTKAAFSNGAKVVVLATDDKLHRIESGEKAAYTLYSKIGYGIIAEKKLADTVDWLMIINKEIFDDCERAKRKNNGRFPKHISDDIKGKQRKLIERVRQEFGSKRANLEVDKVTEGNIAGLFMLTALSPENDFKVKLDSWDVHQGPEFERTFVVNVRPALLDKDRLEDASLVLRDEKGLIVAVCAAKQVYPFSRNAMKIDFYCIPDFLIHNKKAVLDLIYEIEERIKKAENAPEPCILSFCGIDEAKLSIFESLGFKKTGNKYQYYSQDGTLSYETVEYSKKL